jgi:2'-5' RNA ligase
MAKRLFIALPLPPPVLAEVQSLVDELRGSAPGVRWVWSEQLHVTLKFLGDVEEVREQPLTEALRSVAGESFRFNLAGVGCFPNRKRPRVVWTGIELGRDNVKAVASAVEEALAKAGFARDERPFSPHVTLGRVKEPGDFRGFWQKVDATPFVGTEIDAREIRLIDSRLTPKGPIYTDLESFPLRGAKKES